MKQQTVAPPSYGARAPIGEPCDWSESSYAPTFYELPCFGGERPVWADPLVVPKMELDARGTYVKMKLTPLNESGYVYDATSNAYLNPKGKTGIKGRGMLGKYGPNHAADVIVTRFHDGNYQALLVEKKLEGGETAFAWPAGMVEAGESVPLTLRRELTEEAVADGDAVEQLFSTCRKGVVYAGHVDDWRNTDVAWMETNAVHYHATQEIGDQLELKVNDTDEIKKSMWVDMDSVTEMYASHMDWLRTVITIVNKSSFVSHVDWPKGQPPFVSHDKSLSPGASTSKRRAEEAPNEAPESKKAAPEKEVMEVS